VEAFSEPIEFAGELIEGVSHFHLANPFALPRMRLHAAECLRRARAAGLSTSLDTAWDALGRWLEDLGPCLPLVDVLFANAEEARRLAGRADLAEAAAELRRLGAGVVVVKQGAGGCVVFSRQSEVHVPGFVVQAVDTTGAGDCFVGGYLAALQGGMNHPESARVANAAGALSASRLGATRGLLDWDETLAWIREKGASSG
jgi:sugar/nucleoside kinase (ribokinase family)